MRYIFDFCLEDKTHLMAVVKASGEKSGLETILRSVSRCLTSSRYAKYRITKDTSYTVEKWAETKTKRCVVGVYNYSTITLFSNNTVEVKDISRVKGAKTAYNTILKESKSQPNTVLIYQMGQQARYKQPEAIQEKGTSNSKQEKSNRIIVSNPKSNNFFDKTKRNNGNSTNGTYQGMGSPFNYEKAKNADKFDNFVKKADEKMAESMVKGVDKVSKGVTAVGKGVVKAGKGVLNLGKFMYKKLNSGPHTPVGEDAPDGLLDRFDKWWGKKKQQKLDKAREGDNKDD